MVSTEAEFHENRIMVGRIAPAFCPITIRAQAVCLYLERRRDKHVVDATIGTHVHLETIERTILRKANTGMVV